MVIPHLDVSHISQNVKSIFLSGLENSICTHSPTSTCFDKYTYPSPQVTTFVAYFTYFWQKQYSCMCVSRETIATIWMCGNVDFSDENIHEVHSLEMAFRKRILWMSLVSNQTSIWALLTTFLNGAAPLNLFYFFNEQEVFKLELQSHLADVCNGVTM